LNCGCVNTDQLSHLIIAVRLSTSRYDTAYRLVPGSHSFSQVLIKSPAALLSVYDKTNLLDLAKGLQDNGVRLLGSGGTAKKIREAGILIESVKVF
jgi:hypothetical protein